jgi:ABC-type bacteriocin/lantibiotic exporter with double-glycine peptidase domain
MRSQVIVCFLCISLAGSAESGIWLDVPFVRQPVDGCGAASISMILEYWREQGYRVDEQVSDVAYIQQLLFSAEDHGIRASVVRDYFEEHGFKTYVFHGDRQLLTEHIARGRPLMVTLKPAASRALHYLVIAGLEPEQHVILVNDPAQRKLLKLGLRDFEREWKAAGNWTLLAVPRSDRR